MATPSYPRRGLQLPSIHPPSSLHSSPPAALSMHLGIVIGRAAIVADGKCDRKGLMITGRYGSRTCVLSFDRDVESRPILQIFHRLDVNIRIDPIFVFVLEVVGSR